MQCSPFKNGLLWASLGVVALSFWLLNARQAHRQESAVATRQAQNQRASALLFRAFHADSELTYSAISTTSAEMGTKHLESKARIVHAPKRLSIAYLSGDYAGLHGGYVENWSWRQVSDGKPVIPYGELQKPASEMAARRFTLLLENYRVRLDGQEKVGDRSAQVIQLEPFHTSDGATGPAKRIWIDEETGLTLRQKAFNHNMKPIMESTLSEVNYKPQIEPTTFAVPQHLREMAQKQPWVAHDTGRDEDRVSQMTGLYPPTPKWLPAGFEFESVGAHRCQGQHVGCYAVLRRFSDGLNTLSIFALKPACVKSSGDNMKNDAEQSCDYGTGTLVMRDTQEGHLIAVADLPAATLQRVLQSTLLRAYQLSTNNSQAGTSGSELSQAPPKAEGFQLTKPIPYPAQAAAGVR